MKVCIATTSFPRWINDYRAPFMLEFARALRREGHQVRVVAMHNPDSKMYEVIDGIEIIRPRYLPEKWEILQRDSGGMPVMWHKSLPSRLMIFPFVFVHTIAISKYARDCDVIHAHWTLSGMTAWLGRIVHKKQFVVTVHGSDMFEGTRYEPIRYLTRIALNSASGVIAVSRVLAEMVVNLGVTRTKIHIVPDGVDTSRFYPSSLETRQAVLLYVGALTNNKGVYFLIEALPRVLSRFPQARLMLIGDGPIRAEIEKLARGLNVFDSIDWLGGRSQDEVSLWMRRAYVFVLPSLLEGLGVVLLEALSSGLPCIASQVGGIPDVITPDVGLLVPPANSMAIADAILTILTMDRTDYQQMSYRARQRAVEFFDWKKVAQRIVAIYEQVLSE
ncbi:MAG: glycosyltransferase [Candidatus Methanomethyliaceae archaeon]